MAADEQHGGNTLRKIVDYFSHLAVVPTYYEYIKNNDKDFASTPYLQNFHGLQTTRKRYMIQDVTMLYVSLLCTN